MTLRRSSTLRRLTEAEVSASDRARATHTGTQAISTVTGLGDALDDLDTAVSFKANASALGTAADDEDMGEFESPLIDNNVPAKAAIESIAKNLASSSAGKGLTLIFSRRGTNMQRELDDGALNAAYVIGDSAISAIRAGEYTDPTNEMIEEALEYAVTNNFRKLQLGAGYFPQAAGASLLAIPANIALAGAGKNRTIIRMLGAITSNPAVPGSAHQGQNIWLRENASLIDIGIDGGGVGGGVVASAESGMVCHNVHTFNGYGAQSFQIFACSDFELNNVSSVLNLFGTQIWGCVGGRIITPKFDQMVAGVFLAGSTDIFVSDAWATNMEDVGLDIEGGKNCKIQGGYAAACKNGELAIFRDGTRAVGAGLMENLEITGVQVHRTATFTHRDGSTVATDTSLGAVYYASWDEGATGVKVHGNTITVDASAGYAWYLAGNNAYSVDAEFSNNKVRFEGTGALFNVPAKVPGFRHTGNEYLITAAVATPANFKNISGGAFDDNVFRCETTPTDELIYFFTDAAMAEPCSVNGNKFFGAGQYAARFDAFNAGDGAFICANNQWSDKPVVNGGITVSANGNPKWRNEVLLLSDEDTTNTTSTFDFGSLPFLSTPSFGTPYIRVDHAIHIGGAQRNQYDYYYTAGDLISANGSGSGSGKTSNPAFYITFSGDTATVTKTVAANQSVLTLTLNSMNY